jgi:hypothetical protein
MPIGAQKMKKNLQNHKNQSLDLTSEALGKRSRKPRRAVLRGLDIPCLYTEEELQLFLLFASDGDGDIWKKYDRLCSHIDAYHADERLKKPRLRIPSPHYFFALVWTVRSPISPD